MTTDPIQVAKDELLAWLKNNNAMHVLSGNGYIPAHLIGTYLGMSPRAMRRLLEERPAPLKFLPVKLGLQRNRWRVHLDSLAAYVVALEKLGEQT